MPNNWWMPNNRCLPRSLIESAPMLLAKFKCLVEAFKASRYFMDDEAREIADELIRSCEKTIAEAEGR